MLGLQDVDGSVVGIQGGVNGGGVLPLGALNVGRKQVVGIIILMELRQVQLVDVLLLSLQVSLELIGSQGCSLLKRLMRWHLHLLLLFVIQDDTQVLDRIVFELLQDVVFEAIQVHFVGVGANLPVERATRSQLPLLDLLVHRGLLLRIEKVPLRLLLLRDKSVDVLWHQLSAQLQGVVVLAALYQELVVFVLAVQSGVR